VNGSGAATPRILLLPIIINPQAVSVGSTIPPSNLGKNDTCSGNACCRDGLLGSIACSLENKELWDKFHDIENEMIITTNGR
jgi:hypothetical protein